MSNNIFLKISIKKFIHSTCPSDRSSRNITTIKFTTRNEKGPSVFSWSSNSATISELSSKRMDVSQIRLSDCYVCTKFEIGRHNTMKLNDHGGILIQWLSLR